MWGCPLFADTLAQKVAPAGPHVEPLTDFATGFCNVSLLWLHSIPSDQYISVVAFSILDFGRRPWLRGSFFYLSTGAGGLVYKGHELSIIAWAYGTFGIRDWRLIQHLARRASSAEVCSRSMLLGHSALCRHVENRFRFFLFLNTAIQQDQASFKDCHILQALRVVYHHALQ